VGLQCGGWTVGWQGGSGPTTLGATLLDGLRLTTRCEISYDPSGRFGGREPGDIGIVCIAESPYAEGPGDCPEPTASDEDRAVFARMRDRCAVLILVIYSGRPLIIPDLIAQSDAVVAAWLPGTEGAALADLLVGSHPFEGRTPQPWPRSAASLEDPGATPLYPVGHGLGTPSEAAVHLDAGTES
jgi:beta-glucosidase